MKLDGVKLDMSFDLSDIRPNDKLRTTEMLATLTGNVERIKISVSTKSGAVEIEADDLNGVIELLAGAGGHGRRREGCG